MYTVRILQKRTFYSKSTSNFNIAKAFDEDFANQFVEAFDTYYTTGDKSRVICLVEAAMEPHGGRLLEGFSSGK